MGQHVLAALAYSARNPHLVVTLVELSCSGASVFDGIVSPQIGLPGAASKSKDYSQIEQLESLVCGRDLRGEAPVTTGTMPVAVGWRARKSGLPSKAPVFLQFCHDDAVKIDKVLLSVGGNDIGFAGVISWALLPERGHHHFPFGTLPGLVTMKFAGDFAGVVCPTNFPNSRC